MPRIFRILLLFSTLLFFSCSSEQPAVTQTAVDQMAFLKDDQAKKLLTKAIEGSGGQAAWESVREFNFRKEYSLYLENGEVEQSADQRHQYIFSEPIQVNIDWEKDEKKHELKYKNGKVKKTTAGELDTAFAQQRAMNIILSSTFVMSLPYNLIDPTADISYGGKEKLSNGASVEVLQVSYDPEKSSNHSTPDIWSLYFEEDSGELLGYTVQHADHYSYVENLEAKKVNGILMPLKRKSWRVDSLRNPLYLRAEYEYSYDK